jgi:hypothetical protein
VSETLFTNALDVDKNSKDTFLKKLQICMKTYDYKDEARDVKGKVRLINNKTI